MLGSNKKGICITFAKPIEACVAKMMPIILLSANSWGSFLIPSYELVIERIVKAD